MENTGRKFAWIAAIGCGGLALLAVLAGAAIVYFVPLPALRGQAQPQQTQQPVTAVPTPGPGVIATQEGLPTLPAERSAASSASTPAAYTALYHQVNPGVVNIQVYIQSQGTTGQGAGSGFIIDQDGHIVTNNHVVAQAEIVTVVFFDGFQEEAKIIGTDPDSDLAVIQVSQLPDNVHPLALGNSDNVEVGQPVVAIGNPFALGSSLTSGIVSAVGRTIESGATPFAIPEAIQTDAAINPGNSGGPLLNVGGEVIGVNAQIATGGTSRTNSGVGFAIPVNTVRRVVPALIETGTYAWPWLGIRGGSVNLFIQEANNLPTQHGAYVDEVVGGPAAAAGLKGSTGTTTMGGFTVPVGGDVITAFNGTEIKDYSELQLLISDQEPGNTVTLTILRNGQERQIDVQLEARPTSS